MIESNQTNQTPQPKTGRSGWRIVIYTLLTLFLILLVGVTSLLLAGVLTVRRGAQEVGDMLNPVGQFVQQLMVPATPVILPSSTTLLRGITNEARLITLSATYEKVIIAERNQEALWGALGEKLIFVANGTVVAGVDFSLMGEGDLLVADPDTVYVRLPAVEIFDDLPILNNDDSYVADRDTGLLARADPELETQVRRVAEQEILAIAQESNLLEQAGINAQTEMRKILQGLGFTEVLFFEESFPEVTPYVQPVPKGYTLLPTATPTAP